MTATPAVARKPRLPKWALVRYSNVTGKSYIDDTFLQERSLTKRLRELNQWDYLHHAYEGEPLLLALQTADNRDAIMAEYSLTDEDLK